LTARKAHIRYQITTIPGKRVNMVQQHCSQHARRRLPEKPVSNTGNGDAIQWSVVRRAFSMGSEF
jgi:hypothetical protein